jgi:glycosyl transferase family 25
VLERTEIYVVNLPQRVDRRNDFERHWDALGFGTLSVNWIEAVYDHDFGGLGCAKSHLETLVTFLTRSTAEFVMVLEDDFRFRHDFAFIDEALKLMTSGVVNWDAVLLAGVQVKGIQYPLAYKEFSVMKILDSQTTSGYLSRRSYVECLISVFTKSVVKMDEYRRYRPREYFYNLYAIDQTWKVLQKFDTWIAFMPMLGYQTASYSDIEKKEVNYSNVSG